MNLIALLLFSSSVHACGIGKSTPQQDKVHTTFTDVPMDVQDLILRQAKIDLATYGKLKRVNKAWNRMLTSLQYYMNLDEGREINQVFSSQNGRYLVTSDYHGHSSLWDLSERKKVFSFRRRAWGLSYDARFVALLDQGETLIWSIEKQRVIQALPPGKCSFSKKGPYFYVESNWLEPEIWSWKADSDQLELLKKIPNSDSFYGETGHRASDDGRYLFLANLNNHPGTLIDLGKPDDEGIKLPGGKASFSLDGRYLSISEKVVSTETGETIILTEDRGGVFSEDSRFFISATKKQMWDLEKRVVVSQLPTQYYSPNIVISPDNRYVLLGNQEHIVWDTREQTVLRKVLAGSYPEFLFNSPIVLGDLDEAGTSRQVLVNIETGERMLAFKGAVFGHILPKKNFAVFYGRSALAPFYKAFVYRLW